MSCLQSYFEGLGYEIPAHVNPADAYLDIISGVIVPKSGRPLDISAMWREQEKGTLAAAELENTASADVGNLPSVADVDMSRATSVDSLTDQLQQAASLEVSVPWSLIMGSKVISIPAIC